MTRPLYACLYVREFPAQAMLRLRPNLKNTPVVILDGTPPRQTVCSRNARAAALGIDSGLTRAELDVFPGVTHLFRTLSEESSARAALLQCSGRFSPCVECLTCPPERSERKRNHFICLLARVWHCNYPSNRMYCHHH